MGFGSKVQVRKIEPTSKDSALDSTTWNGSKPAPSTKAPTSRKQAAEPDRGVGGRLVFHTADKALMSSRAAINQTD